MCFRFGSCFGSGSGQDYGRRSTPKTTHRGGGGRSHWGSHAGQGYYSGADHKAAPAYNHQQQTAVTDEEAVRSAYNAGGARKDHVDGGSYAPYLQDKAGETLKHPAAWSGKVGDDAGYTYTEHLHGAAAGHREHAAADYHHYSTTTTTTTLARY